MTAKHEHPSQHPAAGPLANLPQRLLDRMVAPAGQPDASVEPNPDGTCVLYWMRMAVRAHDNPALDLALHLGKRLGKPVLVYHAVSERYPFASDRHHAFILQGARDVACELAERGIPYALHVERGGERGEHLKRLAAGSAAVITERVPVPPFDGCGRGSDGAAKGWTPALVAALGHGDRPTPLWEVDTNCIVPLGRVDKAPKRAFVFRDQYAEIRRQVLAGEASEHDVPSPVAGPLPELGFTPVDPREMNLPELLAECAIDHTVPPVAAMPGGSRAGYGRWQEFRDRRLRAYAKRRNTAEDRDGVSRMSAYLHYGHVSPFRLAREAMAIGGAGADKWLDELLIWRELAWAWAHHVALEGVDLHSLDALPAWARETLAVHEGDPRGQLLSWEQLARGRSGDELWDACQESLRTQGELHNNLRMTWGKALLQWTPDGEQARRMLVDLNHRYALDGRDPASYGGLYWCLGLFDKQFKPEQPITGALRTRPTHAHSRRLDLDAYRQSIRPQPVGRSLRFAVVGAGISGLTAARALQDQGHRVVVFEKSRGVGGRMSTRRSRGDGGEALQHDHGAQYFTARDPRFREHVASWVEQGVVAPWEAKLVTCTPGGEPGPDPRPGDRYVGRPTMNAVQKHLAQDLEVRTGVRVQRLVRDGAKWQLELNANEIADGFDGVLVCLPAEQAAHLLAPVPELQQQAARVRTAPCFAAMVTFREPVELPFQGIFPGDSPLSWAAADDSKPGRPASSSWVLHASPEWSREHLEVDPQGMLPRLVGAFAELVQPMVAQLPETEFAVVHRWRYALPENPIAADHLWDPDRMVGAAGDWCGGPRVEGAWLSGGALAGAVLRQLALPRGADQPAASLSAPQ